MIIMNRKNLFLATALLLLLAWMPARAQKMSKIFNGKDLQGWAVPESNPWWSVEGGVLRGKSDPENKGSIMWTQKSYDEYLVQFDYRMGAGTVDSGIFLGDESLQVQIGISGSLKRDMTGSPYIPGTGYPVEAAGVKKLLNPSAWNTMKVRVVGKTLTVWLNGQEVLNYDLPQEPVAGPLGLQVHAGNEMTIDFRNIRAQ